MDPNYFPQQMNHSYSSNQVNLGQNFVPNVTFQQQVSQNVTMIPISSYVPHPMQILGPIYHLNDTIPYVPPTTQDLSSTNHLNVDTKNRALPSIIDLMTAGDDQLRNPVSDTSLITLNRRALGITPEASTGVLMLPPIVFENEQDMAIPPQTKNQGS
jgi:hypothetical protein